VGGIALDATQIVAVAAFLRVLNALENIRGGRGNLEAARRLGLFERQRSNDLLQRALIDTGDALEVLAGGGLHPQAVLQLERARGAAEAARGSLFGRRRQLERAVAALDAARAQMIDTPR
jgi:hypothetical protein